MLVDRIGNEVYASHYAERKAYRFTFACGAVVLLASLGMNLSLARRPIANRYIRIDEMGRAQAIQYSDLNYSPREGEVRTYLTDWANYRYTISRDVIAKKYPLNYYFLSQALASKLMADDNGNHLVSQVTAGQIESSDVQVQNVTITSMSEEMLQGVRIARGTALMTLDRFYSAQNSHEPRTEHWLLSITYYLNPKQVSDQSRIYSLANARGITLPNEVRHEPDRRKLPHQMLRSMRDDCPPASPGRCVPATAANRRARTSSRTALHGVADLRERQRRECLCIRQSASEPERSIVPENRRRRVRVPVLDLQ